MCSYKSSLLDRSSLLLLAFYHLDAVRCPSRSIRVNLISVIPADAQLRTLKQCCKLQHSGSCCKLCLSWAQSVRSKVSSYSALSYTRKRPYYLLLFSVLNKDITAQRNRTLSLPRKAWKPLPAAYLSSQV